MKVICPPIVSYIFLLMMCSVPLPLLHRDSVGQSTPTTILFLRIQAINTMERANVEIGQTVIDIQQSSITDNSVANRFDTVDQATTQINMQKDLAKSLANILSKVDVFVSLIDDLSSISTCALVTGSIADLVRSDPPVSQCCMTSGLVFVQGTCLLSRLACE